MVRKQRFLLLGDFMLLLVVLAACGQHYTATGTGANRPSPDPTAAASPVTLHVDATSFQVKSTISVMLSNQSNQTIYFPDHLTNCTVVLLQRLKVQPVQPGTSDGGQGGINPCRLMIATRMHSLGTGQRLIVKLVAPSTGWLPGLYFAQLRYRSSLTAGPLTTISSPVFQVGPPGPPEP